jgi:hypothetical protein
MLEDGYLQAILWARELGEIRARELRPLASLKLMLEDDCKASWTA